MLGLISYFLIIGVMLLMLWKHPAIALAGVLCMFGLEQWGQATHPFFAQHQAFTNIAIGGILLLALAFKFLKGEAILADYPAVGWLTLTLFTYAFASAIWAPRPDLSLSVIASRGPYILTVVCLTPLVVSRPIDLQTSLRALILLGSFLTLLLLAFVSWESRTIVLEHGEGNPLAVSEMAGLVALAAILGNPWDKSGLWNTFKWFVVILCLFLVVRSGSRGQLIGLIVLSAACWPISRGIKNVQQFLVWIASVLILSGIAAWALKEFWGEQSDYYAGGSRWSGAAMQGAMSERFDQAIRLLGFWYSSPETIFFGLGNSASFDPRILGIYPHFVPLEVLAEEGLLGFGLYLGILLVTAKSAYRSYQNVSLTLIDRPIYAALLAMFLYTFLLSLKQGNLIGNLEPFMFAILLGKYPLMFHKADPMTRSDEAVRLHSQEPFNKQAYIR